MVSSSDGGKAREPQALPRVVRLGGFERGEDRAASRSDSARGLTVARASGFERFAMDSLSTLTRTSVEQVSLREVKHGFLVSLECVGVGVNQG